MGLAAAHPQGDLSGALAPGGGGAMPLPSGAVGEPGTTGGRRLGLSKQLLLSLCEQAEPPQWPPPVRWRAAPPRPAGSLWCPPAPQPWQGPRGSGQVRGAWALTRCVSELRQPQQEARGSHPAARRAGSAALLLSLLGALPQHPAHPAALQAGPGRVQVPRAGGPLAKPTPGPRGSLGPELSRARPLWDVAGLLWSCSRAACCSSRGQQGADQRPVLTEEEKTGFAWCLCLCPSVWLEPQRCFLKK